MERNIDCFCQDVIRYKTRHHVQRFLCSLAQHHRPTCAHAMRVGTYAAFLERELGLHSDVLAEMGAMHDIGKLVLDPALLDKKAITPEEYAAIKVHTRAGYVILEHILPFSACAAGKHHSGYAVQEYPEPLLHLPGCKDLVDTLVPLVTLCDFYDALLTRNTDAYAHIDKSNRTQVTNCLQEKFPQMKAEIDCLVKRSPRYERSPENPRL